MMCSHVLNQLNEMELVCRGFLAWYANSLVQFKHISASIWSTESGIHPERPQEFWECFGIHGWQVSILSNIAHSKTCTDSQVFTSRYSL